MAGVAILAMLTSSRPAVHAAAAETETHALLAAPARADSAESIRRTIDAATAAGFSALVVPASLYATVVPGKFDALAEFIRQAHGRGLRVHAAIDLKAAVGPDELPASRAHVVYQHPEWLMVPREIAVALLSADPHTPNYFGSLARWTRANATRVGALYLSPLSPDAASFIGSAVGDFAARYDLDGIELQSLNYPGDDFDYSRRAMDLFRSYMRADLSADESVRMDAIEAIDPFAYANEYPAEWRRFRMARLTDLLRLVRTAVNAARPGTMVSAALGDSTDVTLDEFLEEWVANRLVDAVTRTSASGAVVFSSSLELSARSAATAPSPDGAR
jgi:uncharacterized lipoprotein YddW (UPF0748 family)